MREVQFLSAFGKYNAGQLAVFHDHLANGLLLNRMAIISNPKGNDMQIEFLHDWGMIRKGQMFFYPAGIAQRIIAQGVARAVTGMEQEADKMPAFLRKQL